MWWEHISFFRYKARPVVPLSPKIAVFGFDSLSPPLLESGWTDPGVTCCQKSAEADQCAYTSNQLQLYHSGAITRWSWPWSILQKLRISIRNWWMHELADGINRFLVTIDSLFMVLSDSLFIHTCINRCNWSCRAAPNTSLSTVPIAARLGEQSTCWL